MFRKRTLVKVLSKIPKCTKALVDKYGNEIVERHINIHVFFPGVLSRSIDN